MDQTPEQLAEAALRAALNGDWHTAISFNQSLLDTQPDDLDALKRLAKAYLETNDPDQAKELYRRILEIDPYDQIAKKHLQRLHYLNGSTTFTKTFIPTLINFIEEPGITKTIQLIEICESCIVATLNHGEPVNLTPRKRHLCVYASDNNTYIGKLSEDLSQRLITLQNGGNQYQAWIKAATPPTVKVFIKEIFRAPQFHTIPSFPDSRVSFLAFTDPNAIHHDRPYSKRTEEQR